MVATDNVQKVTRWLPCLSSRRIKWGGGLRPAAGMHSDRCCPILIVAFLATYDVANRIDCHVDNTRLSRYDVNQTRNAAPLIAMATLHSFFFHISISPNKTSFQLFRPALGPYEKQSIDAPKKESTCCCALLITLSILAARSCRCACDALKQAFWGSSLNAAEQETSGLTFFKTFLLAVKLNLFHWLATQTSQAALGWVLQRLNNRICNTLFW